MICDICPRKCGVNRSLLPGFCNETNKIKIARAALHYFEEPVISGQNGSGAVFFCGCNLRCIYCQNHAISTGDNAGFNVSKNELPLVFKKLVYAGAHNINLVTPTHYTDVLSEIIPVKHSVPVIWNSNGYERFETLEKLTNKVDVFLPDLKYYDDSLALKYSNAPNYFKVATKALEKMYNMVGDVKIGEDGLIKKGLIIRHLVLPGQIENTIKIIDFIKKNYKDKALFSLMFQYVPPTKDLPDELNRRVNKYEYEKATEYLLASGIVNGFVQDRSSASIKYLPNFDGTGIIK